MLSGWAHAALFLILFGLTTGWVPHAAVQPGFCVAISGLAVAWLICRFRQGRALLLTSAWTILAAVPAWIALQRASFGSIAPQASAREMALWSAAVLAGLMLLNELDGSRTVSRVLRLWAFTAGLFGVWALFQGLTSHGRVLWIWDPGVPIERVWGPFLYHNKLAQFAELVLPMAVCLAVTDIRRRWHWVTASAILLAVTVVAASRAGVALLSLELLLCAFLLAAKQLLTYRQAGMLAAQLVLVAGVAVGVAGWENFRDRLEIRQMLQDRRFDLNASSLAMARAHLPWGTGYGAWPVVYPEFAVFDDGRYANQAHNDWLQWLCEGGILGAAAMASFALVIAGPLVRSIWGCGVLFVFVHAAVDYPFHQSAPLAVLVLTVALVAHRDNGRWIEMHQYAPSPVITTFKVRPRM